MNVLTLTITISIKGIKKRKQLRKLMTVTPILKSNAESKIDTTASNNTIE